MRQPSQDTLRRLTSTLQLGSMLFSEQGFFYSWSSNFFVSSDMCTFPIYPVSSNLFATTTSEPYMSYLTISVPTMPPMMLPVCAPMRMLRQESSGFSRLTFSIILIIQKPKWMMFSASFLGLRSQQLVKPRTTQQSPIVQSLQTLFQVQSRSNSSKRLLSILTTFCGSSRFSGLSENSVNPLMSAKRMVHCSKTSVSSSRFSKFCVFSFSQACLGSSSETILESSLLIWAVFCPCLKLMMDSFWKTNFRSSTSATQHHSQTDPISTAPSTPADTNPNTKVTDPIASECRNRMPLIAEKTVNIIIVKQWLKLREIALAADISSTFYTASRQVKTPTNTQATKPWLWIIPLRRKMSPRKSRLTLLSPISEGECSSRTRLATRIITFSIDSTTMSTLSLSPLLRSRCSPQACSTSASLSTRESISLGSREGQVSRKWLLAFSALNSRRVEQHLISSCLFFISYILLKLFSRPLQVGRGLRGRAEVSDSLSQGSGCRQGARMFPSSSELFYSLMRWLLITFITSFLNFILKLELVVLLAASLLLKVKTGMVSSLVLQRPFMQTSLRRKAQSGKLCSSALASLDMVMLPFPPVEPWREVALTLVPMRENCFLCLPMTPTTTSPTWSPILISRSLFLWVPHLKSLVFSSICSAMARRRSTLFLLSMKFSICASIFLIPVAAMQVQPTVSIFWTAKLEQILSNSRQRLSRMRTTFFPSSSMIQSKLQTQQKRMATLFSLYCPPSLSFSAKKLRTNSGTRMVQMSLVWLVCISICSRRMKFFLESKLPPQRTARLTSPQTPASSTSSPICLPLIDSPTSKPSTTTPVTKQAPLSTSSTLSRSPIS